MKPLLITVFAAISFAATAPAAISVQVHDPKRGSEKIVVKLTLKDTFSEKIEAARATIFLLNDENKVVAQSTQWVIGGAKDRPPLLPDKTTTYNFVIKSDKPFTKTKLIFNRIVLEGGKQVDPVKNVEIEK